MVRFSLDEWGRVAAAAERDGLAVGAWVGELACRVAGHERDDVPVAWADVVRQIVRERAELVTLTAALGDVSTDTDTDDGPLDAVHVLILRLDAALDLVLSTGPA